MQKLLLGDVPFYLKFCVTFDRRTDGRTDEQTISSQHRVCIPCSAVINGVGIKLGLLNVNFMPTRAK